MSIPADDFAGIDPEALRRIAKTLPTEAEVIADFGHANRGLDGYELALTIASKADAMGGNVADNITRLERAVADARRDNGNGSTPAMVSLPSRDTATVPPEPVPLEPPYIATSPDILGDFATVLHARGVAGEDRFAKVTYLCLASRVLDRPISLAAKGPSSAGKSFVVQEVVEFFPASAYYALTSMSEHALAYSQEPLAHRFLILYEAAGLESDFASYLLRSLLSEGCVRYETVEHIKGKGMVPRLIVREGPTGLIVTTTQVSLHPENETRLLSVPANDTPEQTAAIIRMLASEDDRGLDDDPEEWRAFQTWIAAQDNRVTIPFAPRLADLIPPVAVRLRRDFATVLNLVKAHAVLHQRMRERDAAGRIVATIGDYGTVRDLVAELVADEVGATVTASVVETVAAVAALADAHKTGVTYLQLGERLGLDKSAARRRARVAMERGYLRNLEDKRGQPARLVVGEPLPGEVTILPTVETLTGGTVARSPEGRETKAGFEPADPGGADVSADCIEGADEREAAREEPGEPAEDGDDPDIPFVSADVYRRAVDVVVANGAASVHLIARRCDCSRDEAAGIMAALEATAVVGPPNGHVARDVLIGEGDVEGVVAAYAPRHGDERGACGSTPAPAPTAPAWPVPDDGEALL